MNKIDRAFSQCRMALESLDCYDRQKVALMLVIYFESCVADLWRIMKRRAGE